MHMTVSVYHFQNKMQMASFLKGGGLDVSEILTPPKKTNPPISKILIHGGRG